MSFKDLYTAVLALQANRGDHCPACDTPLTDAKSNPFEKATAGLSGLKELGELQEQRVTAQRKVDMASRELRGQLGGLSAFLATHDEQATLLGQFLVGIAAEPVGEWWSAVYPAKQAPELEQAETVTLEASLVVADRIAAQDTTSALARQERQQHAKERAALVTLQLAVQAQDLKRKQLVDGVATAQARIAAFDVDNAELIADVAQEAVDIARDAPINAAYDRFLGLLRDYRNELPGVLMAGLNVAAMNLYNEFNRNDLDPDKLVALHLPLNGEQKIEIEFRGNPGVRVDALRIHSEGHIRCLGLRSCWLKLRASKVPWLCSTTQSTPSTTTTGAASVRLSLRATISRKPN